MQQQYIITLMTIGLAVILEALVTVALSVTTRRLYTTGSTHSQEKLALTLHTEMSP
jgi:hypothetical protein